MRKVIRKFQDVFSKEPGWFRGAVHTIKTPPGAIVREKWRPIPHHLLQAVREEVSSMLRLGVVRPSQSPWRSSLVPVHKSDGSLRLCIDYRRLNALAVFDTFPMPQVDELIEWIEEAQYISTLDLAKGYWQIPVAPADQPKTAFGTPWGLYKFVRMPFGLHGVAATFQRLIDQLLAPHAGYATAYIDDINIYSPTWAHHKQAIRAILSELRQAGLTANPQKCSLAKRETKYLGFLVGRGTIRPLADKVETTDASKMAVGAVLTQEEEGVERPIAYTSRKLSSAEKRCDGKSLGEWRKHQMEKLANPPERNKSGPRSCIICLQQCNDERVTLEMYRKIDIFPDELGMKQNFHKWNNLPGCTHMSMHMWHFLH
ncbi:hypothetical protein Y1Q_0000515 [Alligator mississippiensis]|uniref:ribonuclease H n=1 Tax=Alligator mississippiensis TaxID=8496 RepID=A0A151MBH7_ALLMI|nr:hypothetical protein Y1Q_0000515 [Alligator mississippiensis]